MLVATSQDGNNSLYPLALALICREENKDDWNWFLGLLKRALMEGNCRVTGITFISDRQKGIINALQPTGHFPECYSSYCLLHIIRNMKQEYNVAGTKNIDWSEMNKLVWYAAAAHTKAEFDVHMLEIAKINKNVVAYLNEDAQSHEYWATYAFKGERYGHLTSNICESYNAVLKKLGIRNKPIHELFDEYCSEVKRRRISNLQDALNRKVMFNDIVPAVYYDHIEKFRSAAQHMQVSKGDHLEYDVVSTSPIDKFNGKFTVRLYEKSCSCGAFQYNKFACIHAVAVINAKHQSIKTQYPQYGPAVTNYMVDDVFLVETLRKAYETNITVVNSTEWTKYLLDSEIKLSEANKTMILAPTQTKKAGRPAIDKRLVSAAELELSNNKRGKYSCSICRIPGHTMATCRWKDDHGNNNNNIAIQQTDDGIQIVQSSIIVTNDDANMPLSANDLDILMDMIN